MSHHPSKTITETYMYVPISWLLALCMASCAHSLKRESGTKGDTHLKTLIMLLPEWGVPEPLGFQLTVAPESGCPGTELDIVEPLESQQITESVRELCGYTITLAIGAFEDGDLSAIWLKTLAPKVVDKSAWDDRGAAFVELEMTPTLAGRRHGFQEPMKTRLPASQTEKSQD